MTSEVNPTVSGRPHDDAVMLESDEFHRVEQGDSSETLESHESRVTNDGISDMTKALAALLESNHLMQDTLAERSKKRQKVYVAMPEDFDGRVGDYIDGWLEKFETWFRHRERVDKPVEDRERIETAIHKMEHEISIDLIHHEADYGPWTTWEEFAEYMKSAYGSSEPGYSRYMKLRVMTQETNDECARQLYLLLYVYCGLGQGNQC